MGNFNNKYYEWKANKRNSQIAFEKKDKSNINWDKYASDDEFVNSYAVWLKVRTLTNRLYKFREIDIEKTTVQDLKRRIHDAHDVEANKQLLCVDTRNKLMNYIRKHGKSPSRDVILADGVVDVLKSKATLANTLSEDEIKRGKELLLTEVSCVEDTMIIEARHGRDCKCSK